MKDFGKEIGFWRRVREIFAQHQFDVEPSARVRRTSCASNKMHSCTRVTDGRGRLLTGAIDERLDVGNVRVVDDDPNTLRRIFD